MAVRSVPSSTQAGRDKSSPVRGTTKRGPVSTSAGEARFSGVDNPAHRENSEHGSPESRSSSRSTSDSGSF
jgi:hypothetical protein